MRGSDDRLNETRICSAPAKLKDHKTESANSQARSYGVAGDAGAAGIADLPPNRYLFGMDYDPVRHYVLMFGGYSSGPARGDTWLLALEP